MPGSTLPVAMACSVEASMRATRTPSTSSRMRSAAATTSVMVSGSGPSSRTEPAQHERHAAGDARVHHAVGDEAGVDRGGDRAVAPDLVDDPEVVAVAALGAARRR